MIDKIGGLDGIANSRESREAGAANFASSLYGAQGAQSLQSIQGPTETKGAQETSAVKGVKDKIDISESEDAGGANLEALKGSFGADKAQGFTPGVQPSFSINSVQGVQAGVEPGMQKAGVFKSPPEF